MRYVMTRFKAMRLRREFLESGKRTDTALRLSVCLSEAEGGLSLTSHLLLFIPRDCSASLGGHDPVTFPLAKCNVP
jgi:hypothetical protein